LYFVYYRDRKLSGDNVFHFSAHPGNVTRWIISLFVGILATKLRHFRLFWLSPVSSIRNLPLIFVMARPTLPSKLVWWYHCTRELRSFVMTGRSSVFRTSQYVGWVVACALLENLSHASNSIHKVPVTKVARRRSGGICLNSLLSGAFLLRSRYAANSCG
jgi:hypothetical protein